MKRISTDAKKWHSFLIRLCGTRVTGPFCTSRYKYRNLEVGAETAIRTRQCNADAVEYEQNFAPNINFSIKIVVSNYSRPRHNGTKCRPNGTKCRPNGTKCRGNIIMKVK